VPTWTVETPDGVAEVEARLGGMRTIDSHPIELAPTPRDQELAEFHRQFPEIADLLKVPSPGRPTLFDPGRAWYPGVVRTPAGRRLIAVDWRAVFDKHISGDWGLFCMHDPSLVTEEASWAEALQPIG